MSLWSDVVDVFHGGGPEAIVGNVFDVVFNYYLPQAPDARYEAGGASSVRAQTGVPSMETPYYNEAGQFGWYSTEWQGNDLSTTWVDYVAPVISEEKPPMLDEEIDTSWPDDSASYPVNGGSGPVWGGGVPIDVDQIISRAIGGAGGGGTQVAFPAIGGAVAAGARTLASIFGRASAASAAFSINGIRGTIPQLWKYTRKYGPQVVAQGLGISVGALGAMLLSSPDRARRRRRGISGRDIRTTKRVVNFVSRMAAQIGCVRAPAHFRRSSSKFRSPPH